MKFKGAVIAILATILTVNCFTAYVLISEAKTQTKIQKAELEIVAEIGNFVNLRYDEKYGELSRDMQIAIIDAYKITKPDQYN